MAKQREREIDLGRLATAMQKARLSLKRYRDERREAIRQYAGKHYSEDSSKDKVPINLLSLYVQIVGKSLIAKNPRVMLSTFDGANKPAVKTMQRWANQQIERMNLANTLQRIVVDGLFSVGICKVALATPSHAASVAWGLEAGKPFAERVSLDDFVFDVNARDFDEVAFIGHRFRVPLATVKDSSLYSAARKDLGASVDPPFNEQGDERAAVIGKGYYSQGEEFEDMVDLWEIYLPRHRVVLTLADEQISGSLAADGYTTEALRTQAWVGPEKGPYHILSFGTVPDNPMPKAPIPDLIDLHDAINLLYRKLIRQAERQKTNLIVQGGADADGSRIVKASDGEGIRSDNPEKVQERSWGGPDEKNFKLAVHLKDEFSRVAGNLDMMGGLSPQSKTLGQDQLLAQNASSSVASMQDRTTDAAASVIKALCWYWWHDPVTVMKTHYEVPGVPGVRVPQKVTPQQRTGAFEELDVQVDPYSLKHSTPEQRLAGLNQVVTQIIAPMMQILQQQGVQFDVKTFLEKVATYMDMPDLSEIVTIGEPPPADQGSGGGDVGGPTPAETTRNYVRRSVGADTGNNRDAELMNSLSKAAANGGNDQ